MSRSKKANPTPPSAPYDIAAIERELRDVIGYPEKDLEVLEAFFSARFQHMEQVGGSLEVDSSEYDALHCMVIGIKARIAFRFRGGLDACKGAMKAAVTTGGES